MKKSELVERVAQKAEITKNAAQRAVEAIFDATSGAIAEAIRAGEHVTIPGFGRFKPKERAARKGRNPQTGKEIQIPARKGVGFAAGKGFADTLQGNAAPGGRAAAKKSGGAAAKKGGGAAAKKGGAAAAKKSEGAAAKKAGGAAAKKGDTSAAKGAGAAAKKGGAAAKKGGAAAKKGGAAAKKR